MLRCTSAILSEKLSIIVPVQYQTMRWKRKPRKPFWLGTAKSKRFRIHDPPVLPTDEAKELHRLQANYKTALRSIRKYFESVELTQIDALEATAHVASPKAIEASLKINDVWNAASAVLRKERLSENDRKHEDIALQAIISREAKKSVLQERVEEMVRLEKARSKDFIVYENLDAKIEECLESIKDYNFAIDLQGNIYTGFESEMKAIKDERQTPSPSHVENIKNG